MSEARAMGAGFDADWLYWREAADTEARDTGLLARWLDGLSADGRVVELGAGTGSLLRACLPYLRRPLRWEALEVDSDLIARGAERFGRWAVSHPGWRFEMGEVTRLCGPQGHCQLEWQTIDLAREQPNLAGVSAIAASAWGDLVSWRWAADFAAQAAASGTDSLYLALNVIDGAQCLPQQPLDRALDRAFSAHMRRDKGFGPALGGGALPGWSAALSRAGYRVDTACSAWSLGPAYPLLTAAWLEGYVKAACEQNPRLAEEAGAWLRERRAQLASGALRIRIVHGDLLAWRT
jgi:hypothetical protein